MNREQIAELMRTAKQTPAAPGTARLRSLAKLERGGAVDGKPSPDRWLLHNGTPCETTMGQGVNNGDRIWLLVDLATLSAPDRAKGFWEHYEYDFTAIGTWHSPTIDATGYRAQLDILKLSDAEMDAFPFAVRLAALVRNSFPLEASIGVHVGPQGKLVRVAAPLTINGRTYDPSAFDAPLYAMYGGVIHENSTCLYGSDSNTGAGLSKATTQEHTMPPTTENQPTVQERLKAMLGKHTDPADQALIGKLISEDKKDAEITEAVHAAQLKRLGDANAALTQRLADAEKKPGKPAAKLTLPGAGEGDGAGEGEADAPANIHAALAKHASELKGMPMPQRLARMHELYPKLPR